MYLIFMLTERNARRFCDGQVKCGRGRFYIRFGCIVISITDIDKCNLDTFNEGDKSIAQQKRVLRVLSIKRYHVIDKSSSVRSLLNSTWLYSHIDM